MILRASLVLLSILLVAEMLGKNMQHEFALNYRSFVLKLYFDIAENYMDARLNEEVSKTSALE